MRELSPSFAIKSPGRYIARTYGTRRRKFLGGNSGNLPGTHGRDIPSNRDSLRGKTVRVKPERVEAEYPTHFTEVRWLTSVVF